MLNGALNTYQYLDRIVEQENCVEVGRNGFVWKKFVLSRMKQKESLFGLCENRNSFQIFISKNTFFKNKYKKLFQRFISKIIF